MAQKPRKLIVHAGMHKTGSTAIQHWLRKSRLPGSHYFTWRNANHSDLFVLLFEDNPQKYPDFARAGYTREQALRERAKEKDRICREIETAGADVFVFSAERVSAAPDAAVEAMQSFFSEFFPDIQLYAYVRRPSGFMTSMFQQHLKTGWIKLSFRELWPNYRRRLKRFYRIFGRRNVHLRSYDQQVGQGNEIVGDFAAWTGLAATAPRDIVRNWSMSATGTALLYFYRKHIEPELPQAKRATCNKHLLYVAQSVAGEAFHIDLSCAEPQRGKVAADLKWISERVGVDLDDLGVAHDGGVVFTSAADIDAYAVAKSHELMPWKRLAPLDPEKPESLVAARARFLAFLSPASMLRASISRRINRATGRDTRKKP
jgi:hypothetical protein